MDNVLNNNFESKCSTKNSREDIQISRFITILYRVNKIIRFNDPFIPCDSIIQSRIGFIETLAKQWTIIKYRYKMANPKKAAYSNLSF
ncbi:Hypothetical protein CINCED_3A000853 [Cinara cedri]|uniref:Uncharacterized protein n=1 Tax=Cinara cedri TaxID=506608 RepID=A0A5E4NBK1_9HEMI|nr:Hypothetical protein CINCED_3A000853 [Cinara cedri]